MWVNTRADAVILCTHPQEPLGSRKPEAILRGGAPSHRVGQESARPVMLQRAPPGKGPLSLCPHQCPSMARELSAPAPRATGVPKERSQGRAAMGHKCRGSLPHGEVAVLPNQAGVSDPRQTPGAGRFPSAPSSLHLSCELRVGTQNHTAGVADALGNEGSQAAGPLSSTIVSKGKQRSRPFPLETKS